jgi:hypothetical protein
MQTGFSMWIEGQEQTGRAVHRLRRQIRADLPGVFLPSVPLPPWIFLEGSDFVPRRADPPPFWAAHALRESRIVRRDISSKHFSCPSVDLSALGLPEIRADLVPGLPLLAYPLALSGGALPDLRQWSFGCRSPGSCLENLGNFESDRGWMILGMPRLDGTKLETSPGEQKREGDESMDRWQIPVSQRCFSRGSIHALRVEWEDDGSAIRWESMLQIDLVQNRKRGV